MKNRLVLILLVIGLLLAVALPAAAWGGYSRANPMHGRSDLTTKFHPRRGVLPERAIHFR